MGGIVFFSVRFIYMDDMTSATQVSFSLPFTASASSLGINCRNAAHQRYINLDNGYYTVHGVVSDSQSTMYIEQLGDHKNNIPLRHDQLDSAYNWLEVSGHYFVD